MAKYYEGNRKPQRWSPELGKADVTMVPNPNGGWVEYKDYLKLLEVLDDALDIIERD